MQIIKVWKIPTFTIKADSLMRRLHFLVARPEYLIPSDTKHAITYQDTTLDSSKPEKLPKNGYNLQGGM